MSRTEQKELKAGQPETCVEMEQDLRGVRLMDDTRTDAQGRPTEHRFAFSRTFGPEATQQDLFAEIAAPMVNEVIGGYNAAIMAYGQTGSGKTFSMLGPKRRGGPATGYDTIGADRGLMPRMVRLLFERLGGFDEREVEVRVTAMYIEIYMERLYDLLNPAPKPSDRQAVVRETAEGTYIRAREVPCRGVDDVMQVLRDGSRRRATAATSGNDESSRSHAVLQLCVERKMVLLGRVESSVLQLCDLAGSECARQTGADRDRRNEAAMINRGLTALGDVCVALTSTKRRGVRVPFRASKLTEVTRQSFGGNARTAILINCSPSYVAMRETLSSLRFGDRAANIRNKPKRNVAKDYSGLRRELEMLNGQLTAQDAQLQQLRIALRRFAAVASEALNRRSVSLHKRRQLQAAFPLIGALDDSVEFMGYLGAGLLKKIAIHAGGATTAVCRMVSAKMSRVLADDRIIWRRHCEAEIDNFDEQQHVKEEDGDAKYRKAWARLQLKQLEALQTANTAAIQEAMAAMGIGSGALRLLRTTGDQPKQGKKKKKKETKKGQAGEPVAGEEAAAAGGAGGDELDDGELVAVPAVEE